MSNSLIRWMKRVTVSCAAFLIAVASLPSTAQVSSSLVFAEDKAPTLRDPDRVLSIPMRDGVKLPANLYLPKKDSKEKLPCILVRHPLGKDMIDPAWLSFVDSGYALVVQSTRSCCDESGKSIPYLTDGWSDDRQPADGYDTVQWIASSDFCDGSVSTIGVSATGITQFLLAPASPPNLRCQSIEMAAPSMYQYAIYPGGQFRKEQVEGWLKVHKRDVSVVDWLKGKSRYDNFWSRFNALDYVDQVRVPQLHIGGWYDIFLQGTIDAFVAGQEMSHHAVRKQHRLIIGPWGHMWRYTDSLADSPLSEKQKKPPYNITTKEWLDFHAKGVKNIVAEAPLVQYYVMGPFEGTSKKGDIWRVADSWPIEGVEYQRFALSKTNSLLLNQDVPESVVSSYKVLFTGASPVPTIGGRNLFIPDGPRDISSIVSRDDVVVFASQPLDDDIEVTGRLWANLHVGDVIRERDVCLRLVDIAPSGKHYIIAEGVAHVAPKPGEDLSKGNNEPRLVIIDLWSTSMVFAKGHKIGLVVSASNYPAYEIAGDQSEEKSVAFTVHSSKRHPSYLSLPVMKDSK